MTTASIQAAAAAAVAARPSRTERNAAVAAAAAAQVAATCPWGACDSETASTVSSRQPSSRNTCPWGKVAEEVPQKPQRRTPQSQDTCPWSSSANDKDSAMIERAERRRQRPSPTNFGRAGAGAPKLPASLAEAAAQMPPVMIDNSVPKPQSLLAEAAAVSRNAEPAMGGLAEVTQRFEPDPQPIAAQGAQNDPSGEDDEDEDHREQREIVQHCLAEGLDEEAIMEILEEWQNQKLLKHTQQKMRAGQPAAVPAAAPAAPAAPVSRSQASSPGSSASLVATGTSLAASRQAKAKKSLSFGPTDEEIVDVLKDYSKENLTPPESPGNVLSLVAKRKKDRETSEASVGSFDSDKSRAAYLQSKRQMDAVKSKNRMSSGIF